MNRTLTPTIALFTFLLATACSTDEPTGRSGISTATGTPRPTATVQATSTATPARTPGPAQTIVPPTAQPTEIEVALAALANEDAAHIAGAMEELLSQCTDDRPALGGSTERVWRILNEQRGLNVPVLAILNRVILSLPIDGRDVACESLFASVVTELSR